MRVAILGCGYVGLELGRQLRDDHDVVGVRRSDEGAVAVEDAGLTAVQADVTDAAALEAVPDVDALVFAVSSGGRGAAAAREVYVDGLRTAIDAFADRDDPPGRLVYTSSTGVYGDHDGAVVDETTPIEPTTAKTRVLAEAERVAREHAADRGIDGTVARFAGLYGPGRYRLERYLEGPVTEGYRNVVHRDDAAGAVAFLLERAEPGSGAPGSGAGGSSAVEGGTVEGGAGGAGDGPGDVVLVVDDEPADKWAFADWLAEQCGVDAPPKRTTAERLAAGDLSAAARRRVETSKRCSNARLRDLGYAFRYPTSREGYQDAIEGYLSGMDGAGAGN